MKKIIAALLSLLLLLPLVAFTLTPVTAAFPLALPTSSTIQVNGVNTSFQAYLIGSSNYFKLRDIAMVLSGTDKQVAVDYDQTLNGIVLTSGKAYIPIGG